MGVLRLTFSCSDCNHDWFLDTKDAGEFQEVVEKGCPLCFSKSIYLINIEDLFLNSCLAASIQGLYKEVLF